MATTAVAEISHPGGLTAVLAGFKPYKAKRITLTGGSVADAGKTTAWATGVGVSFTAALLGFSKIDDVIIESNWVNAAKTASLNAAAVVPAGGATARVLSFGADGAAAGVAALPELTSDAYTCQLIVLGS